MRQSDERTIGERRGLRRSIEGQRVASAFAVDAERRRSVKNSDAVVVAAKIDGDGIRRGQDSHCVVAGAGVEGDGRGRIDDRERIGRAALCDREQSDGTELDAARHVIYAGDKPVQTVAVQRETALLVCADRERVAAVGIDQQVLRDFREIVVARRVGDGRVLADRDRMIARHGVQRGRGSGRRHRERAAARRKRHAQLFEFRIVDAARSGIGCAHAQAGQARAGQHAIDAGACCVVHVQRVDAGPSAENEQSGDGVQVVAVRADVYRIAPAACHEGRRCSSRIGAVDEDRIAAGAETKLKRVETRVLNAARHAEPG